MSHVTISTMPPLALDFRLQERRQNDRPHGWQTSGGVVVDVDTGRVALVKNRRERRQGSNGWTWPKGRIDVGEGPLYAAIREIREECGVLAEPLGLATVLTTRRALRHYYVFAKIREGLPFTGETLDVRWVSLRKARSLLERKRDREVLRAAKRVLRQLRRGELVDLRAA
jgi:ADP-ribose pyrophosphatase YjhB (NUDIX family)